MCQSSKDEDTDTKAAVAQQLKMKGTGKLRSTAWFLDSYGCCVFHRE